MPLLNYTTKISPEKTVGEIEKILVAHGARAFLKEIDDDGFVKALAFKVNTPHGDLGFRLPIDAEATLRVMEKQARAGKLPKYLANEAQARRTAWRIVKDWIEAQMAILETEMVRMEQIFLPYLVTPGGRTLYEGMVESKFLLKEGDRK
jgi:tRNA nucleotidyltransferase/poly(A) polymerase